MSPRSEHIQKQLPQGASLSSTGLLKLFVKELKDDKINLSKYQAKAEDKHIT
jgi:hypothetical protein